MKNNDSSANVASRVLRSATLPKAQNEHMRSSSSNLINNLSYRTHQIDYCDQNSLAQENNNNSRKRGANSIIFPSAKNVTVNRQSMRVRRKTIIYSLETTSTPIS